MNNMIGFLDVNAKPDSNRRENNHPKPRLSLKIINQALAAVLALTFSAAITIDNDRAETKILVDCMLKLAL